VGLERGPLSLVSTIEELLGRKISFSGLESRDYALRDPSRWPRGTLYPQKLALTSLTSGGRSVGIVLLRTQAKEFFFLVFKVFKVVTREVLNAREKTAIEWKSRDIWTVQHELTGRERKLLHVVTRELSIKAYSVAACRFFSSDLQRQAISFQQLLLKRYI
jgi:hypothetical protein